MTERIFKYGGGRDQTDGLANSLFQYIDIYHLPTQKSLQFKAYITAFTDQYASEWNSENVFGRMDPIQTFKGTNRKISLGWDVPAASFEEAKDNLRKASLLISMLYPTYDEDGSGRSGATLIDAPPLFKLKFMNLIQESALNPTPNASAEASGLVGTMSGFTYEPDLESGFFQATQVTSPLELNDKGKKAPPTQTPVVTNTDLFRLFPQTIKFQCEFTVLHQHRPGWSVGNAGSRFQKFPYSQDHPGAGTEQTRQNTNKPSKQLPEGTATNPGGGSVTQTTNGDNRAAQQKQDAAAAAILASGGTIIV